MSHVNDSAYTDPKTGARVTVTYTTDERIDTCPFCVEGLCEQRVESCEAWESDLVIHDRPRFLN